MNRLWRTISAWMHTKTSARVAYSDVELHGKCQVQQVPETRSTRQQILDHLKLIGHQRPPYSMSNDEMEALLASGKGRVEELRPAPRRDLVRERPPTEIDSPKDVEFGMSLQDRNFWFNIVVGCSGPDATPGTVIRSNGFRSRNAAKLEYAMADVERLHDFVKNPFSDPELIMPVGYRACAGTFAEIIYLREPGSSDLQRAFQAFRSFVERNEGDPEWMGGQLNFFFAGHGTNDRSKDPLDCGGLWLKDKVVDTRDLHEQLLLALPTSARDQWHGFSQPGNCRVDMYLDCCYSGQLVAAFVGRLLKERKGLVPGKFWCSSMPLQESFESDEQRHGVFTAYFLNDYSSRKRRDFAPSVKSGDVGRATDNRQNPFLIDFTSDRPPLPIVPGAVGINWIAENELPLTEDTFNGANFSVWLAEFLCAVHTKNWGR